MPEPVKGFAESVVKEAFPAGSWELVNSSERFRLGPLFSSMKDFGTRSMRVGTLSYPYWENAARYMRDMAGFFLVLAALLPFLASIAAPIMPAVPPSPAVVPE